MMINEKELNLIKRYISCYAPKEDDGHYYEMAPLEKILKPWEESKSKFLFSLFGENNLILKKEITYQKDETAINEDIASLFYTWSNGEGREFRYACADLAEDIGIDEINHLFSREYLASNIYEGKSFVIKKDEIEIKVPTGCKVSRKLGKIASAFNLPGYESFRLAHSRILNEKTLKGNLCISIHPLDYMTMSDNDCGWDSCMNWRDDGDYRLGTVEMMNSPLVVVGYLAAAEDMDLFEDGESYWNNKKWRELFVVSKGIITGIKGYPYWNRELEKEIIDWLKELSPYSYNYYDDYIKYSNGQTITLPNGDITSFIFCTGKMYNDFKNWGGEHYGYIAKNVSEKVVINYSGIAECMICGEPMEDYVSEDRLICLGCDPSMHCECCGEEIYSDEQYYLIDGKLLCRRCYEEETFIDAIKQEVRLAEKAIHILLVDGIEYGNNYTAKSDIYISEESKDDFLRYYLKKDANLIPTKRLYRENTEYYVIPEDCEEDGLNLFGFNSLEEVKEDDGWAITI